MSASCLTRAEQVNPPAVPLKSPGRSKIDYILYRSPDTAKFFIITFRERFSRENDDKKASKTILNNYTNLDADERL